MGTAGNTIDVEGNGRSVGMGNPDRTGSSEGRSDASSVGTAGSSIDANVTMVVGMADTISDVGIGASGTTEVE